MNGSKHAKPQIKVGIIGTGFISSHFVLALNRVAGFKASKVLTRRNIDHCSHYPRRDLLTNSLQELMDCSDVIVECSGHVIYATNLIDIITQAGIPVVTLNSNFHITAGSYFVNRSLISEAEGDQPGSLAALKDEVIDLGFKPLAYLSIKGFINPDPTQEDMEFWSKKQGISVNMTTSFTDGTKLHIEQTLAANGLGAIIPDEGMMGPPGDDLQKAAFLISEKAEQLGYPLSDYVLSNKQSHGVLIVATHGTEQTNALNYLKAGNGPHYVILKHTIFAHLEVVKTIKRLVLQKEVLLDNSDYPVISVGTIAKRDLKPGEKIECGAGSFQVRGKALTIKSHRGHFPIGILYDGVVRRPLKRGELLTFDDIDVPDSLAVRAWLETERKVLFRNVEASCPI